MNPLHEKSWSPWVVGAGLGALNFFTFLSAQKPIGVTTAIENTASGLGQRLAPKASGVNAYLAKSEDVPRIDWEWMFNAGIVLGSFLSARAARDWAPAGVPLPWRRRFGGSKVLRALGAFVGGMAMLYGARVAKGCTSGHMISGNLQFSAASWSFSAIAAAAAMAMSRVLFGGSK